MPSPSEIRRRLPHAYWIAGGLAVLASGSACAQESDTDQPESVLGTVREAADSEPTLELNLLTLQWENDSILHTFFGPDIDRWYTNGLGAELSFQPNAAFYDRLIEPIDFFDEFEAPRSAVGLMLRHSIYTPGDILTTDPQPDDFPYGGLLTLGAFVQRSEGVTFDHLQLDIGVMGQNSGAQALQEWVHSALPNQGDPKWVNQLASGLAVTGAYQRRWKLRWQRDEAGRTRLMSSADLTAETFESGSGIEVVPYAGIRVGNVHDDLALGTMVRWGWPLPDDFGPSRIAEFTDHTRRANPDIGFSVFARGGARFVARNAFIEGNILGGDRRLEPKPIVGELQVGAQLEWRGCILGYTQALVTDEFEGQASSHRYGTFTFTYNFLH